MTKVTSAHKIFVYLSYHVIHEDGSSWRLRELDEKTMQSAVDGYCSVYRTHGDELHQLDLKGYWQPVEWEDEESVEEESANPAKSSTSTDISDEERPD